MASAISQNSLPEKSVQSDSQSKLEKRTSSESSLGGFDVVENPAMEARVWRKLDLRVLPVVAMFYFLSFLVCSTLV